MELSAADIAAARRWPEERTRSLEGRCRGDLLGPWSDNIARRFGAGAVERVRSRLSTPVAALSPNPTKKQWLPVAAQVEITEAIIDEVCAGDGLRLYPLLEEDTRRGMGRAKLALIPRLGPRRVFKMAPRTHGKVYDVGALEVDVGADRAELRFDGAPLFGHPTWRLLQLFAQQVILGLAGRPDARVIGSDRGPDGFGVRVSW